MNIMRLGSRFIESSSPVALIATGAAIAVAFPPVRKGLRSVAVLTTRGALALADSIRGLGYQIKESTANIVSEARDIDNTPQEAISETMDCLKHTARKQGRRVAVATAAGALVLSDKAKSLRKNFKDVVDEAKADLAVETYENNEATNYVDAVDESQASDQLEESSLQLIDDKLETDDLPRRRATHKKPVK
jgi:hypothetical protein